MGPLELKGRQTIALSLETPDLSTARKKRGKSGLSNLNAIVR